MRDRARTAAAWAAFLAIAALVHAASPRVPDDDTFYHLAHARELARNPFDTSFPWAAHSLVGDAGADLWWAFHLLLIPFARFLEGKAAMVGAGALVGGVLLGLLFTALRRLGVRGAFAWALFLPALSPETLFRSSMVRPQVLSTGLALLATAVLATGGSWVAAALVGLAGGAIHATVAWVFPAVALAGVAAAWIARREIPWKAPLALVAGTAAGVVLRPAPGGTLRLLEAVTVRYAQERVRGTPLLSGRELQPMALDRLGAILLPLLPWIVLAVVAAVFLRRRPDRRLGEGAMASALLGAGFLALALAAGIRAIDLALPFLGAAAAVTLSSAWDVRRRAAAVAALALMALTLAASWGRSRAFFEKCAPYDKFREASAWIAAHARPGEIVFHGPWDNFGALFYRNPANRYVGGMDPILQYLHDPALYWQAHHVATDRAAERTCPAADCTLAETVPTYEAIRDSFKASWVFVQPLRTPGFHASLLRWPDRFERGFDNGTEAVFRVRPAPPIGGEGIAAVRGRGGHP